MSWSCDIFLNFVLVRITMLQSKCLSIFRLCDYLWIQYCDSLNNNSNTLFYDFLSYGAKCWQKFYRFEEIQLFQMHQPDTCFKS